MDIFDDLRHLRDVLTRQVESLGGVYGDPFNEIATVVSVSDPKKLGRVKVSYQDGGVSDWIYVLGGSNKGLLSAQFIGSPCLIGKANGNSEDAFVLGFFNKSPEAGYPGSPIQLPILSEQVDMYRTPASPGDNGLQCNEGNAARVVAFDNEMHQVARICLRTNSRQEGGEPVWSWVDITPSKLIEKGADPGVPTGEGTSNFGGKIGIPKCTKALEGQTRDYAEDRKFRSFQIKCGKDENGAYVWSPISSTPVFFRTTLPQCTEKLHGMDAILDEGLNSQGIKCLRYQGAMKWINPGKREPIQFFPQDPPPTKQEFIQGRGPIQALATQVASPSSQDFIGKAGGKILDLLGEAIPVLGTASQLGGGGKNFDELGLLSSLAQTALSINSGLGVADISTKLIGALSNGNIIDDELASILGSVGGAGDLIASGIRGGDLDGALVSAGKRALAQSLGTLSPELYAMYSSYASGGALGAIDTAVGIGLNELPQEVSQYISPIVSAGRAILSSSPTSINNILDAALGIGGKSLPKAVEDLVSVAGGTGLIPSQLSSNISGLINSGELGEIAQMFGDFSNLSGIATLGGVAGVPQLATTALGLVGLGEEFTSLLGGGGIGLNGLASLAGINPVTAILGGVPGLGSVLGVGSADDCPCGPKCRKIKHSEDSDGQILLEKCGNVIANSASSYNPDGDPTKNNLNKIAEIIDLIPTGVGEDLCIPNSYDLTQLIKNVRRLDEMADRIESAKNADWPELWSELTYTFETIEKAFKQADNNITGVESIERKLIDAQHRLITKLMDGNGSFFSKALISIVDTSKAVQDLYRFVLKLDAKKKGGRAGVFPTTSLITVFENITKIALLNSASKKEAKEILSEIISPADKEWRKLEPGGDLLDLTNVILGLVPKDIPLNFEKCLTKRDKNKILKDSIESKINSPVKSESSSLFETRISENARRTLSNTPAVNPSVPNINSLLDQIKYEQGRADTGEAEC